MNKMKVKVKKIIAVFALIVLINNVMYCANIIEKKEDIISILTRLQTIIKMQKVLF